MKKVLAMALFLIAVCNLKSHAYTEVIETIKDSTATVSGVRCSTGTAIQLDSRAYLGIIGTGYNRAWVRVQNQDSADSVWIGFDAAVSTHSATAAAESRRGEQLGGGSPGGNSVYNVSKNIGIWCKAADAAGATGALISISQYGYK